MTRYYYQEPFECLLLYHSPYRKLYNEKDIRVCASEDGIIGVGKPSGACRYCPNNNVSLTKTERCKELCKLFILRQNNTEPEFFIVPPTSVNAFNASVKLWLSGNRANRERLIKISKDENGRFIFENLCSFRGEEERYPLPTETDKIRERISEQHKNECIALARRTLCIDTE